MEHFYEELRNAREALGLSLKDVSVATKISPVTLDALEHGNIRQLPNAYIRAFIREFAKCVRLDEKRILDKFEDEFHGKHLPLSSPESISTHPPTRPATNAFINEPPPPVTKLEKDTPPRVVEKMRAPHTKRTDTNMTVIISVVIVILTGLIFVYFFFWSEPIEKNQQSAALSQAPPPIVPQYMPPAVQETTAIKTAAVSLYPADSITIEAIATDSVWVSVVADTTHVQRGSLGKGDKKSWRAKNKFLMTVGNSKLVSFKLNGKPLPYSQTDSHVLRNMIVTTSTSTLGPQVNQQPQTNQQPQIMNSSSKKQTLNVKGTGITASLSGENPQVPAIKKPITKKKVKLRPFKGIIQKVPVP